MNQCGPFNSSGLLHLRNEVTPIGCRRRRGVFEMLNSLDGEVVAFDQGVLIAILVPVLLEVPFSLSAEANGSVLCVLQQSPVWEGFPFLCGLPCDLSNSVVHCLK